MSDIREALAQQLCKAIGAAAGRGAWFDDDHLGDFGFDGAMDLYAVADAILATHLVVPRSDIVATEYGVRQYRHDRAGWHVERASSRDGAVAAAQHEHYDDDFEGRPRTQAVERPLIPTPPWSVIPLPEDGEKR